MLLSAYILGQPPSTEGQARIADSLAEWLVIFAVLLSLPLVYYQEWASDRNVLRGIKQLFLLIFFTFLIGRFFAALNGLGPSTGEFDSIFHFSWAFYLTIFIYVCWGTIRNLIFIKQKQHTALNFTLLLGVSILYSIIGVNPERLGVGAPLSMIMGDTVENVVLFILINLMVINSFRVSWINYLNKKQKVACFWGGLFLIPIHWFLTVQFMSDDITADFSQFLDRFLTTGVVFTAIYLSVAFLALMAYLPTAQLFDRKIRQIESLHDLSRAVNSEFDLSKLVVRIVQLTGRVTEAESCWLELVNDKTGKLELVAYRDPHARSNQIYQQYKNRTVPAWMMQQKLPFLENQVHKNKQVQDIIPLNHPLGSLLMMPLLDNNNVVGFLYAGKSEVFGFDQDDIEMLRAFSAQVVNSIENARLVEASIIKERLEQELRVAHDAQMKLLPKSMPEINGLEIQALCQPANEVGGDYYDFFKLGEEKLGVVVGDVSGKGASAAFYMAELKGIMGALIQRFDSPFKVLTTANRMVYTTVERNHFVTLIYGIIDTASGCFTFCRAGHTPVLLASQEAEAVKRLEPHGLGLGLDSNDVFEQNLTESSIRLHAGQTLLFYTDGAVEVRNKAGEEFGEERLEQSFFRYHQQPANTIKENCIQDIREFIGNKRLEDDLTFVVIKVKPEHPKSGKAFKN